MSTRTLISILLHNYYCSLRAKCLHKSYLVVTRIFFLVISQVLSPSQNVVMVLSCIVSCRRFSSFFFSVPGFSQNGTFSRQPHCTNSGSSTQMINSGSLLSQQNGTNMLNGLSFSKRQKKPTHEQLYPPSKNSKGTNLWISVQFCYNLIL